MSAPDLSAAVYIPNWVLLLDALNDAASYALDHGDYEVADEYERLAVEIGDQVAGEQSS